QAVTLTRLQSGTVLSHAKDHIRRTPIRTVAERYNAGVFLENRPHDFALNSDPTPMDDTNLAKPALDGLKQILFHDNPDLAGLKRVQVNRVFDRNLVHSIKYNRAL